MRCLLLVLLAGCYDPVVQRCSITCDPEDPERACPSGLTCGEDFHCHGPEDEENCTFSVELEVISSDSSIARIEGLGSECSGSCTVEVVGGSTIALSATSPTNTTTFVQFGNDCAGPNTCSTVVSKDLSITATLSLGRKVGLFYLGDGVARVTSEPEGIDCSSSTDATDCLDVVFPANEEVTLTATPEPKTILIAWSNCDAQGPECKIPAVPIDTQVTAEFDVHRLLVIPISVNNNTNDPGSTPDAIKITGSGIDIACTTTCELLFEPMLEPVPSPPTITLTPAPGTNRALREWFGEACSVSMPCMLTMDTDRTIVGVFDAMFRLIVNVHQGLLTVESSEPTFTVPRDGSLAVQDTEAVFLPGGTEVRISRTNDPRFQGFAPAPCAPDSQVCTFLMTKPTTVTGTYKKPSVTINNLPNNGVAFVGVVVDEVVQPPCGPVAGDGQGLTSCFLSFNVNSVVQLTAPPFHVWTSCPDPTGNAGSVCTFIATGESFANLDFPGATAL